MRSCRLATLLVTALDGVWWAREEESRGNDASDLDGLYPGGRTTLGRCQLAPQAIPRPIVAGEAGEEMVSPTDVCAHGQSDVQPYDDFYDGRLAEVSIQV